MVTLTNLQTAVLYVSSILILSFFTYIYRIRKNNIYLVLGVLPILTIATFRYKVGTDYIIYEYIYQSYKNTSFIDLLGNGNIEIGYFALNKIGIIFDSFKVVLFLSSLIIIAVPIWTIKDDDSISLTIFSTFYSTIFFGSFNIIRQSIASAIIFNAIYKYIKENNIMRLTFFIIIASFFHASALIILPFMILIISKHKLARRGLLVIAFLTVIFIFLNPSTLINVLNKIPFLSRFTKYFSGNVIGNNFSFYLKLLIFTSLFSFRKKYYNISNQSGNYFLMSFLNLILTIFGFRVIFVKRIAEYFYIFTIMLISTTPFIFVKNDRTLVNFLLIFYSILMFIINYWAFGFSDLFPYKF